MTNPESRRRQRRHAEARRDRRRRLEAAGVPAHLIEQVIERMRAQQAAARRAGVQVNELDAIHDRTHAALSPDDRGYRPDTGDPLLRGAARATGDTARAVKARRTYTAYQLKERP